MTRQVVIIEQPFLLSNSQPILHNILLASCPWGPATAPGVGLLTEMYAIYITLPNLEALGQAVLPF